MKFTLEMFILSLILPAAFSETDDVTNDSSDEDLGAIGEVGKLFLSQLSDELIAKLSNMTEGSVDMGDLDNLDLTESEKKEFKQAIRKAFEPMFGKFVDTMMSSGFTKDMIEINEIKDNTEEDVDKSDKINAKEEL